MSTVLSKTLLQLVETFTGLLRAQRGLSTVATNGKRHPCAPVKFCRRSRLCQSLRSIRMLGGSGRSTIVRNRITGADGEWPLRGDLQLVGWCACNAGAMSRHPAWRRTSSTGRLVLALLYLFVFQRSLEMTESNLTKRKDKLGCGTWFLTAVSNFTAAPVTALQGHSRKLGTSLGRESRL
jgi:hypothetical protein